MNPPLSHRPTAPQDTPSTPSPAQEADASDFAEFIAGQDPLDAAAAGWMVRRHDGLTPQEEEELQQWLAADPAHGKALAQVEGVWGRMDELPEEGVQALKAGLPSGDARREPLCAHVPPVAPPGPVRPQQPQQDRKSVV